MHGIRKILVATDASRHARRAEARAAMLGVALECDTLEIMTVKSPKTARKFAALLERGQAAGDDLALFMENSLGAGLPYARDGRPACIRSLRFGKPAAEIVARANELPADLTIVGAHGGNFFTQLFFGYNMEKLVHSSQRPLLIVKGAPRDAYRRVLIAVDFSAELAQAARLALDIAPAAQVTFLHAFHVRDEGQMRETGISEDIIRSYRVRAAEQAGRHLDRFIAALAPKKQLLSRAVHHGSPVPVILHYASKLGTDLIALGKHGRSCFEALLLGSTTRRILDQAACDVLVSALPGRGTDPFNRPAA